MANSTKQRKPIVFISSTSEDLESYREKVRDTVQQLGMDPLMFEYNPARGDVAAYEECMRRVRDADVVVAIVAHWYGWIPKDQPKGKDGPGNKSITWLECAEAWDGSERKEVLGFVVETEAKSWPNKKESDSFADLSHTAPDFSDKVKEIQQRLALLDEFKKEVSKYQRRTFTSEDNLAAQVAATLPDWRARHGFATEAAPSEATTDATPYLVALARETAQIDIKGIQRGQKEAARLSIVDLYIPLTHRMASEVEQKKHWKARVHERAAFDVETVFNEEEQPEPLEGALNKRPVRLLVVGDPGTGKSTFARRVICEACAAYQGTPFAEDKRLLQSDARFPILVRLSSLADFVVNRRKKPLEGDPTDIDSPEWLPVLLSRSSDEHRRQLGRDFVRNRLDEGALVILDGLDEVPESVREEMIRLVEKLPGSYAKSDFIVTSRPSAFGGVTKLGGFRDIRIGPLTDEAIKTFVKVWCGALYDGPETQEAEQQKLSIAVGSGDIAALARNPLMLTCLAVLRWNEEELPDRRAELYELILSWLARQRKDRPGRPGWDRCLQLHQKLALTMHTQKQGKQVEIGTWEGVKALSGKNEFRDLTDEDERTRAAEQFLKDEENDSGIVIGSDGKLRFWHQHFQEHLAAQALAGQGAERRLRLFEEGKLHDPDWRETVLLLAGSLLKPSAGRLDDFLREVLGEVGPDASLEERARMLALIGAMLRDVYSAGYRFHDDSFADLVGRTMAVFELKAAHSLDEVLRADAADAIGLVGDRRLDKDNWVRIEEGTFWMGAQKDRKQEPNYDPQARDNEAPVHKVQVSAFEIGRFPVTVAEYAQFVDDRGYDKEELWIAGGFGDAERPGDWEAQVRYPNRPVINVSWFQACAYAASIEARLPTEAEWERAARIGREGAVYPWGASEPNEAHANFRSRVGHATPVGIHPEGAARVEADELLDMAGNVWEWCSDWYDDKYYGSSPDYNPNGPAEGEYRVLRGGSWGNVPEDLRCSNRLDSRPVNWYGNLGFRCVREVIP